MKRQVGLILTLFFSFITIAQGTVGGTGGGLVGNGGGGTVTSSSPGAVGVLDLIEKEDVMQVDIQPTRQFDNWMFQSIFYNIQLFNVLLRFPNFYSGFWQAVNIQDWGYNSFKPADVLINHSSRLKLKPLKFYMTPRELPMVADEGVIHLDSYYEKTQLALQKDGNVLIDQAAFEKLDERNKTALLIHEYVLYVTLNYNPTLIEKKGTEPVRKFVRRLVSYLEGRQRAETPVPLSAVEESLRDLGTDK